MKKISNKIFFDQQKISIKKIFDQTFSDFFRRINIRPENFGLPIPIPKFPKIPKIALRKLCDEAWHTSSGDFCYGAKSHFSPTNLPGETPSLADPLCMNTPPIMETNMAAILRCNLHCNASFR